MQPGRFVHRHLQKERQERKLVRIADRDKALRYEVKPEEMLLTVHRWFARKSCPGNWLMERLGSLADGVNGKLAVIVCFRSFQHCFRHRMPSSYFASNAKPPFVYTAK